MVFVWRVLLPVLLLFQVCAHVRAAAGNEKGAFKDATKALEDGFYERAESAFGAFVQQYTNSQSLAEAILCQAQARIELTNYNGAIELLSRHLPQAGKQSDGFTFWLGEAFLRKGDLERAVEQFAALTAKFPASALRLRASVSEAVARSRLGQWSEVISLLQETNSVFQSAARSTNSSDPLLTQGHLILSEAFFARRDFGSAERALQPISEAQLPPKSSWERQFLQCRIQFEQNRVDEALRNSTNLLTLATNTAQRSLQSESLAFQAGLFEKLRRTDEAIETYERNLADDVPQRQLQALLKISELALGQNRIPKAAGILEKFCAQHPNATCRDVALLRFAELRLHQQLAGRNTAGPSTNAPQTTNYLQQAIGILNALSSEFPKSALLGKANFDLGWCFWLEDKMKEAQSAFEAAVDKLPFSAQRGSAQFKLADVQFRLNNFPAAISNYSLVIKDYADDPEVKTNLFEPALYQIVRAGVSVGDISTATNALAKLLATYPAGYHTERAVLLTGQTITSAGDPAMARKIFLDLAKAWPDCDLMPELQMAIAGTFEKEQKWDEVITSYEGLLSKFTNSTVRPRAEYGRAWANFQAGRDTNAMTLFINFIANFPEHECTPSARWWVADYYSRTGRFEDAEKNYQLIFQNTNSQQTDISSYEAKLAAGRTAAARTGWKDARAYFTNMTLDAKCPPDLWVRAMFGYGDVLMSMDSTNKQADYELAFGVFSKICELFPTNEAAILATGQKAHCLLQLAQFTQQYEPALREFEKLTNAPLANFTVRSDARLGIATILEKQAQQRPVADQLAFLKSALNYYLDVFYFEKDLRPGEQPNLFWVKKAGLEAARMSESMQEWPKAIHVYERLRDLLPALRATFEKKSAKAMENLARVKP